MIKLKHILLEQKLQNTDSDIQLDVPQNKTGTIISGISNTDPWEYYFHDADQMWKTKKKTASKFLDMKTKLVRLYGDEAGMSRYETAIALLNSYIQDRDKAERDGKKVVDVVIPDNKIEIPSIHIDYSTQKVKEKLIDANGTRNKSVDVLGKSDDGKYLKVRLHNRGLFSRNIEVYVEADSFDIAIDGKTAEYNGKEGKRYNLYKIK
jgi:hypothetical protein